MGLTRRRLMEAGLALVACIAVPVGSLLDGTSFAPRRVTEAVRGLAYPGRIRKLDPARIGRPSPWLG